MERNLQEQTLTPAILQTNTLINWGILGSLMLAFMLFSTSSFATCYGNVNDGGEIGYDQTICSGQSVTLSNVELPSGGYGDLEYMWLSNTDGPDFNGSTGYPSSSPTFDTGNLTETTWFRRCSRRDGCSSWNYGESNWIQITVAQNPVLECEYYTSSTGWLSGDCNPEIYEGESITLSALPNGFASYSWTGPNGFSSNSIDISINNATSSQAGTYTALITNSNGCSSSISLTLAVINSLPADCDDVLVNWDLDACQAYSGAYSYDEFTPTYTSNGNCGNISATTVYRDNPSDYYHSCLQGEEGNAMCISGTYVDYVPTSSVHKLNFSVTLNEGTQVSGLSFYQKSEEYILNNGQSNSILNNYLKKYSVRARINGNLVYQSDDNNTSQNNWDLSIFDFSANSAFDLTATTTIDFEIVAYDPVGNSGSVRAWEIDEIEVLGCCAESASVGDFVFNDVNGNGIQDTGDFGLSGVSVMLINTNDNSSETTTTNQDGNYTFNNVEPGNYKVKFPESGTAGSFTYNLTQANQGGDDDLDSDAIAMNNGSGDAMTQTFVVNAGDEITNIDAGYYIGSKLAGIAFAEVDADGLQDGTETRIDGITVMLLDQDGNMITSTTTANGGEYEFENLAPGSYKVKFPEVANLGTTDYTLTRSEIGNDDDIDSDAVPMNDGSGNAMTQVVYIENGITVDNLDAGYIPTAKIGDKVFEDKNENGIQDNMDAPYTDVSIMLLGTDIFGNSINETTTTDANGIYEFSGLAPGTYELKFTSNSPAFIPTIKDFSGNGFDEDDSDIYEINGRTDVITINAGDYNKTIDAGFIFDPSLPVNLTNFEAQLLNNNEVLLKWSTASEIDNRHFVIERSVDGIDFEPIGVEGGNGTSNLVNYYSFEDLDPFYGANYYRLKQVDFNGDYEFSHVETVIIAGHDLPDLIVYPNPVVTTTTLRVVTPFETDAEIEIVDQSGKVIKVITMQKGANSKQIDLSTYSAGAYFAYINYNNHRTLVYTIIKVDE